MPKTRVAIFDMDLIAYRCAAATEARTVNVTHLPTGKEKVFKTRTEFKKLLTTLDRPFEKEKYEFQDIQTPEPESHTFQMVKNMVNSISEQVWADRIEGYVGGKENFRLKLDLPVEYKGSRKDMLRPINLGLTKKFILNKYPGSLIEGIEVDDYVNIRYHELVKAGEEPVVITLDKDTDGCVGIQYFDWTQDNPSIFEVPVFGNLTYDKDKDKVEGCGLKFYCFQLLHGDPSDDYSPKDLHGKRLGKVRIYNLLKDATTVDEIFSVTLNQYKSWFPDPVKYNTWDGREVTKDHLDLLAMYHKCVYMHRVHNDPTDFFSLWHEFKGKE